MNFWKSLPNATRIYLVILIYLVMILCGLVIYRQIKVSPDSFTIKKAFRLFGDQTGTTLTAEAVNNLTPTFDTATAWLRAKTNVRVYEGPGEEYPGIAWLENDQTAEIVGVNQDKQWWAISLPYFAKGRGWVQANQVEVNNVENVSIVGADTGISPTEATPENYPRARAIANVNIRSGPDLKYRKIGTLEDGQTAEIVGVSIDKYWWLIKVPDTNNVQGWISIDYVIAQNADNVPVSGSQTIGQVTPAPGGAYLTAKAAVNVRSGPDITYAVVGQLGLGQLAEIIGTTEDGLWWEIKLPGIEGDQGWVAAAYVEAQNISNVPVIK
jgi:uncharacterized protein YraI